MRRRVFREVGTVAGVVVILAGLVLANGTMRRGTLAEKMVNWREGLEAEQQQTGLELLKWPLLQETTGGYRSGPTFDPELKNYHGQQVNIMGFQVPVEQFRDMTEFLLLPMPIECYFCQRPPMKDVVLVHMASGEMAPLVKEPVLINGRLELHEGPKTSFFYTIEDAKWGPGKADMKVHRRDVDIQHRLPHNQENPEDLLEGTGVPQAESVDTIINSAGSQPASPAPAEAPAVPPADGPVTPPADSAAIPAPAAPETAPPSQ